MRKSETILVPGAQRCAFWRKWRRRIARRLRRGHDRISHSKTYRQFAASSSYFAGAYAGFLAEGGGGSGDGNVSAGLHLATFRMHSAAVRGGATGIVARAEFGAEPTASCGSGHIERAGPRLFDRGKRIGVDGAGGRPGADGGSGQRWSVSASAACFSKPASLKTILGYEIGRGPAVRARTPRSISKIRGAKFFVG